MSWRTFANSLVLAGLSSRRLSSKVSRLLVCFSLNIVGSPRSSLSSASLVFDIAAVGMLTNVTNGGTGNTYLIQAEIEPVYQVVMFRNGMPAASLDDETIVAFLHFLYLRIPVATAAEHNHYFHDYHFEGVAEAADDTLNAVVSSLQGALMMSC
jgi:hypothetical protein